MSFEHILKKRAIDRYDPCPDIFTYKKCSSEEVCGSIEIKSYNFPDDSSAFVLTVEYGMTKRPPTVSKINTLTTIFTFLELKNNYQFYGDTSIRYHIGLVYFITLIL